MLQVKENIDIQGKKHPGFFPECKGCREVIRGIQETARAVPHDPATWDDGSLDPVASDYQVMVENVTCALPNAKYANEVERPDATEVYTFIQGTVTEGRNRVKFAADVTSLDCPALKRILASRGGKGRN